VKKPTKPTAPNTETETVYKEFLLGVCLQLLRAYNWSTRETSFAGLTLKRKFLVRRQPVGATFIEFPNHLILVDKENSNFEGYSPMSSNLASWEFPQKHLGI